MPLKANLKFEDYTFYFVPDKLGKYSFKDVQGNVFRLSNTAFTELYEKLSSEDIKKVQTLMGFANIREIKTGKYLSAYEIFGDLREEINKKPTNKNQIYLNQLREEIQKLQTENQTLRIELDILRRVK